LSKSAHKRAGNVRFQAAETERHSGTAAVRTRAAVQDRACWPSGIEPVIVHLWLQLTEQIFPTPTQAVAQHWKHSCKVLVFAGCAFEVCAKAVPDQVMRQSNATAENSLHIAAFLSETKPSLAARTQRPTHTHDLERRSHSAVQWFVAPNCGHSLLPGSVAYDG
jgi:hypothetical protein